MKKNSISLNDIGLKYGTDKSSSWHNYLKYYELVLNHLKDKKLSIFEIGVWANSSLKTWEEYFINSKIVGFDIEDKKIYESGRIYICKGDQSIPSDLLSSEEKHGPFDIIIDDGSHHGDHQFISFNTLFPKLNSGGYYIIEDCLCAYDRTWNTNINILDKIKDMVGDVNMNGKIPNSRICANKEEAVKLYDANYFEKNIEYIFVFCGLCFIKKI